jgi:hypothetical protein
MIDEERKADRFLLLYTRADSAGESQSHLHATGGAVMAVIPLNVKRALNGTLELETTLKK